MLQLGYLVDLNACQFDEDGRGWIHAMPIGKYVHPTYGEIDITPERVQRFAQNVANNVRGQEIDIDYDHKAKTTEAAGWVKQAEARDTGLWLLVEWTKEAFGKIKARAYKYFSPELVDEWTHPASGEKFKDVLFGGGLTNRPFLKGILPINLSELSFGETNQSEGGQMDPKQIRLLLGLPEDATDEQVTSAITGLVNKGDDSGDDADKDKTPQLINASEIAKLAEQSPAVKALTEQLAQLQATMRLSDATADAVKLTESFESEGVRFAFGEPVRSALQEVLVLSEGQLRDKIKELFVAMRKGVVPLGETGGASSHSSDSSKNQAIKAFSDAVAAAQRDRKLGYTDATLAVSAEQPRLFEEYRQASFAGRE